jgi:arginine decarboxylase
MNTIVHKNYFVCAGSADAKMPLNAFDHALLAAGIGDVNLVRLSSILPPSCQVVEPFQLPYGALVPVAYADMVSSEPGQWVSAAVAIAIPLDPTLPGLIMEHHGVGRLEEIEATVREMAVTGFQHRNREIKEIVSIGAEHQVDQHGAAFAGVVLWTK